MLLDAVSLSSVSQRIIVRCDDTDVLVLLIHYFNRGLQYLLTIIPVSILIKIFPFGPVSVLCILRPKVEKRPKMSIFLPSMAPKLHVNFKTTWIFP